MKFLVLSDLHLEFASYTPPAGALREADAVILAGDIMPNVRKLAAWATRPSVFGAERPIIVVAGNHEYYGGRLEARRHELREASSQHVNVHVLDPGEVLLDDGRLRVLGCTLWSDFELPIKTPAGKVSDRTQAMATAGERMNDYQRITLAVPADELQTSEHSQRSSSVRPFTPEDDRERLAGMEAIWLAYTYCGVGVARCGRLDTVALQGDLDRAGISLWNGLDAAMEDATSKGPLSTRPERDEALLRLRANVYKVDLASLLPLLPAQAAGKSAETSLPTTGLLHVVCRSAIPKSSDRQDIVEIDRHRVLEKPLPATLMPTIVNLQGAFDRLLAEFPWAASAIQAVFDDLLGRASLGVRLLTLPATLLIGHPGAGKSRLARRIAEELDLTRLDVSLSGNGDTKQLSGTSRGWSGGRPSDLASLLARRRTASALVTLDEIDKARDGGHREGGGIAAYLLPLLEPETACRHYDNFLKAECDFSLVSCLATGNALSGIPKALQSRLRILLVPQPRRQDLPVVCAGVIKALEKRWQLPAGTLPSAQEIGMDVRGLSSARQARVATEAAVSAWARAIIRQ